MGINTRARKNPRASFRQENIYRRLGYRVIAGLDEVGRGAWAGPLVAAAVVLPANLRIGKIYDSKALSPAQRAILKKLLTVKAVSWGVGQGSVAEIEKFGLSYALRLAYQRALSQLSVSPDLILLDGRPLKNWPYPHKAIIKGDCKVKSIAAASIVAKEYRDRLMIKLSRQYPHYGFARHKGYGTAVHRAALIKYGACPVHRKNYRFVRDFINTVKNK